MGGKTVSNTEDGSATGAAAREPAGFRRQAGALIRKQASYQKRNLCQNLSLLFSPIFFCMVLFILQQAINTAFDDDAFKCGCECLLCCRRENNPLTCYVPSPFDPPCLYRYCLRSNEDNCDIQFSDAQQSAFCGIDHAPEIPPILQVPRESRRALRYSPNLGMPYTSDAGTAAQADALASDLFTPRTPEDLWRSAQRVNDTFWDLLRQRQTLTEIFLATPRAFDDNFDEPLGSRRDLENVHVIDDAFTPLQHLYVLADAPTCEQTFLYVENLDKAYLDDINEGDWRNRSAQAKAERDDDVIYAEVPRQGLRLGCLGVTPERYADARAINDALYCGFARASCPGKPALETAEYPLAFDFKSTSTETGTLDVRMFFNDTTRIGRGGGPPEMQRFAKPINMVTNAWLRRALGPAYSARQRWIKHTPAQSRALNLDFASLLGPQFYLWVLQLILPVILQSLVYEKEQRLRIMMRMHGLSDVTYWFVSYLWWFALSTVYSFFLLAFGSAIGLEFFRKNSASVQIVFYLLLACNQIGFAFLLSCFISNPRTALTLGYLWVIVSGFLGTYMMTTFIERERWFTPIIELIPAFGAYRGLYEFAEYAFRGTYANLPGLRWEDLSDDNNGLGRVMYVFVLEWIVFSLLAWYLSQVMDAQTGSRRHPLFFLPAKYRVGFAARRGDTKDTRDPALPLPDEADDVQEERARVEEITRSTGGSQAASWDHPIVVRGLQKTFPATGGNPPKQAVQSLSVAVDRGEVFGLLGPNGAGKTTSISMLVGLLEASGGSALIQGFDINKEMQNIYSIMGVCPQHDILWGTLTAAEHLRFYGRLKNIPEKELKDEVMRVLRLVNLHGVAHKKVKTFSGGMKRRLSFSISIMGDPAVVFLDEPSTGLDPASRRNMWEVIRKYKRDKALILTTHSMQEAEVLCDRLGIFVEGKLFCLGNPKNIISRYGGYILLTITTLPEHLGAARKLAESLAPDCQRTYALGGTQKFHFQASDVQLSQVFRRIEEATSSGSLQLLDWAVHHANLEDVFLEVARGTGAKLT
ncbi:unnamed protein product [Pedinophyceae sp. YPF-701]|nr:unnamed protein product [Pedinophyceae sp. YPF-701]